MFNLHGPPVKVEDYPPKFYKKTAAVPILLSPFITTPSSSSLATLSVGEILSLPSNSQRLVTCGVVSVWDTNKSAGLQRL